MNDRIKLLAYRILDPIKAATKPQTQMEQKPMSNTKSKPEAKADVKAVPKTKGVAIAKPANISKTVESDTPEANAETSVNLTPQLVKRVHAFYEELGREEVQAVNDMEQTAQKGKLSQ
jgi:H+-transporting ATPase